MQKLAEIVELRYPRRESNMKSGKGKKCPKCHGTGKLFEYGYYRHGKCFECNGTGKRSTT